MNNCILLVGNIASGKSTWVKQYTYDCLIINDDPIVTSLHGGNYLKYNKRFKPLYKTIENLIFGFAAANNVDVIIDRPNLTKKTRRRYIGLANCFDMKIMGIVFPFDNPKIHAARRMEDDSRGYSLEYWIRVADFKNINYEKLDYNEGFTEIKYV